MRLGPDPQPPAKPPRPKSKPTRQGDGQVDLAVRDRLSRPRRYKVLLHNDDFTPMEFVVEVLTSLFHKSSAEATRIMLHVHRNGVGVAGVYSHEVAESKALRTIQLAREAGFPLMASTEPEEPGSDPPAET